MKKISKNILLLTALFGLVGCGPTSNPTTTDGDPTSTSDPTSLPSVEPIPEDNKVHIFILAGQSGARGKALASDLDRKETLENKEVQILADGYQMPALSNIAETPNQRVTYKNMSATFGDVGSEFGPELGLAKALTARYPRNDDGDYRSAIIKYTACGSTFYDHWYSESALEDSSLSFNLEQVRTNEKLGKQVGPLTNNYYQLIDQGISYWEDSGFEVVVDGVIFSHGEQDAKFDENMAVYEKTLEYFIQDTRAYIGNPELPFIITEALTNSAKYSNELRAIQARVAEKTGSMLLDSSDLYQNTFEPWHLGARSNVILGERAGAELIALKDNREIIEYNVEEEINVQVNTKLGLPNYLTAIFDNEYEAYVPVTWDESFNPTEVGTYNVKATASYNTHVYEQEVEVNVVNNPHVNGYIDDVQYGKETKVGDKVTVKFATTDEGLYVAAKATDDDIWTDGEEWKQNDMGQMGKNDDLGIYITTGTAEDRFTVMLSSCDVLRVYKKGYDTTAIASNMPENNLHFKNQTPNFAHRTLTEGVVNGGECSEIRWEMFISYEDLGIENAADLKVFARYSDISSENGTGTDKVEVKTYFEGSNASHEKDIANYIAINDLI